MTRKTVRAAATILAAALAITSWKLQSEPWLFLIGRDGKVAQRFEGPVVASTIRPALKALLG
ncbi:MAG TPA: hypothetical protein VGB64_13465 [Actinomycetota bacterium]